MFLFFETGAPARPSRVFPPRGLIASNLPIIPIPPKRLWNPPMYGRVRSGVGFVGLQLLPPHVLVQRSALLVVLAGLGALGCGQHLQTSRCFPTLPTSSIKFPLWLGMGLGFAQLLGMCGVQASDLGAGFSVCPSVLTVRPPSSAPHPASWDCITDQAISLHRVGNSSFWKASWRRDSAVQCQGLGAAPPSVPTAK